MGIQADIYDAFATRLQSLVFSPVLPVAYPGVDFAGAEKLIAVEMYFNQTRAVTIGDDPQQLRGIFQATVIWPSKEGIVAPLNIAGDLVQHFRNLTLFASGARITVSGEPWAASPIIEPDRITVPVSVNWSAFGQET